MPNYEELKRSIGQSSEPGSPTPSDPLPASADSLPSRALDPTPWLSPSSPNSSFQARTCWRPAGTVLVELLGLHLVCPCRLIRSPDGLEAEQLCGSVSWARSRLDAQTPAAATLQGSGHPGPDSLFRDGKELRPPRGCPGRNPSCRPSSTPSVTRPAISAAVVRPPLMAVLTAKFMAVAKVPAFQPTRQWCLRPQRRRARRTYGSSLAALQEKPQAACFRLSLGSTDLLHHRPAIAGRWPPPRPSPSSGHLLPPLTHEVRFGGPWRLEPRGVSGGGGSERRCCCWWDPGGTRPTCPWPCSTRASRPAARIPINPFPPRESAARLRPFPCGCRFARAKPGLAADFGVFPSSQWIN